MSQENLEGRLQALLDDSGLALPPRPDATGVVLRRVRRVRRRRRAVQTAVPALLTVAAIAVGISVAHHQPDQTPTQGAANILSGTGIGRLKIGMAVTDAQDAGLLGKNTDQKQGQQCQRYEGKGGFVKEVLVDHGIVTGIKVEVWVNTPAGIYIGETYGELRKAYPNAPMVQPTMAVATFAAPDGPGNLYQVDLDTEGTLAEGGTKPMTEKKRITGLALISPGAATASAKCKFV
jgi:hypothetical protein